MRNRRAQYTQPIIRWCWPGFFSMLLLVCLLLLNACSDSSDAYANKKNKAGYQSTVSMSLLQEGQLQLQTFQQWLGLMQQFKGDISPYQQDYFTDLQALNTAKTGLVYQDALATLIEHVKSIKIPALKAETGDLQHRLNQQATDWGKDHTYHDRYNNTTYQMGYEYGPNGMSGWVADELSSAQTLADYQQAIEDASASLISFQAYKNNINDTTPWNQSHLTDLQLIQRYGFKSQRVIVVSLSEQTLRIYNDEQLVKAFHVTTGRPEKPSLPGSWLVENKLSPTIFKSTAPKGSAYWYPDTPIHYAMLYHSGGYFIHDSWWRDDYGPNTQFPHVDSSGDSFSFDGSHGCINVATANAAWIYRYVDLYTHVLIY